MRITVFGATGNVGKRVIAEALSRDHEVVGVARNSKNLSKLPHGVNVQVGDANNIQDVIRLSKGCDVVINTMRPSTGNESEVKKTTQTLMDGLAKTGVRLLVSGGAASLKVPNTNSKKVIDDLRYLPESARDIAQASIDQYNVCLSEERVDWVYFSPPANLIPGKRTGEYALGTNELIIDEAGNSEISMEDFAVALLDEVESPRHHLARITAAYN